MNGVLTRSSSELRLKETTEKLAPPTVGVIVASHQGNKSNLDLPGRLEAYYRAPIYARVSGFLKAWYVDIGAPGEGGPAAGGDRGAGPRPAADAGEGRPGLGGGIGGAGQSDGTALVDPGSGPTPRCPCRRLTEKTGDLSVKEANMAAKANVERLQVRTAFKKVTSPFSEWSRPATPTWAT